MGAGSSRVGTRLVGVIEIGPRCEPGRFGREASGTSESFRARADRSFHRAARRADCDRGDRPLDGSRPISLLKRSAKSEPPEIAEASSD